MTRHMALCLLMGTLTFAACDSAPSGPTPAGSPTANQPTAPPRNPAPSPVPGGSRLVGSYLLTLDMGSGCSVVPASERIRRYTADITYVGAGRYVATLNDATFLTGLICTAASSHFAGIGCHQFFASEETDTVNFSLANNNDEAHGGHIVERLSSGGWVEIIGDARAEFDPTLIEASGAGSVWYCPTPSDYPFPCANFTSCRSNDMRLTFTRQSE
jgi:hypothetical protein